MSVRVLFLAAEADPFVKIGGLGDVAGSLPAAILSLPDTVVPPGLVDVRVAIPLHPQIKINAFQLTPLIEFDVPHKPFPITARAFSTPINGVEHWLIDGAPIAEDTSVYSQDNLTAGRKFAFFSIAALELAHRLDWIPDILHANDWHTAFAIQRLRQIKQTFTGFSHTRSLITIHNLPFMGAGSEPVLKEFSLPGSRSPRLPGWARQMPLPVGILWADRIVAVSPSYAREILTPESGCSLEGMLASREADITGILNGLDGSAWDPAKDASLASPFSLETLPARSQNKAALQSEVGLEMSPETPLLILISRMDVQKGIDLAVQGLRRCANLSWQAVLLGTGDPELEQMCQDLADHYPDKARFIRRFDANLARRMYASGDILLMPSRYEPCGLAQMIAMRYGCVPLARATGGLKDTILDSHYPETDTGFLFSEPTPAAFVICLKRALKLFANKGQWHLWQQNGMRQDFSWKKSAWQYVIEYISLQPKKVERWLT